MRWLRYFWPYVWFVYSFTGIGRGQTLADLFDTSKLQEIRLEMSTDSWKLLHDNYMENTYYHCDVRWRDMVLPNSGVRSRGTGSRNPIKPALAIDFSKYDSGQRLLGLKSLILRNFLQDPSMMHEVLTLKMFEKMGLPYERTAWARLYVNGEYVGLYQLVEPIDSRFLRVHFGEDTGYLYEFNWVGVPYHFEYLGEDPALYVPGMFEPKNHEDDPQAEVLVEWIRQANEASDDQFAALMNQYVDLPVFLTHLAVEQYVSEFDGLLGFAGMTNFYLYRRTADNRFVFLVWDKDNSFHDWQTSVWNDTAQNVLIRRALAVPLFRQRYLEALHHTAEVAGSENGWLAEQWRHGYAVIREAAREDRFKVRNIGDGKFVLASNEDFEEANGFLQTYFSLRTGAVNAELVTAGFSHQANTPDLQATAASGYSAEATVLSPGSLARLHMTSGMTLTESASALPLPRTLAGISLRIGSWSAPLVSVTPGEVIWQVPWEVPLGPQMLCVAWNGRESQEIVVDVHPNQPEVARAFHASWLAVDATHPALAGETLVLYLTGLGNPLEKPLTGMPAPADRTVAINDAVTVTADGKPVKVVFTGLAPGLVGLQVTIVQWPDVRFAGKLVPLILTVNGEAGKEYWVPVS